MHYLLGCSLHSRRHERSTDSDNGCPGVGPSARSSAPNGFETRFTDGGVIDFKLSSGDYTVQPGTGERIVLRWLANDPADELRGEALGISSDGFRNSFDWNGSGKCNLRASLFAGDLTLEKK